MTILAAVIALLVGLSLGLLGAGGSILTVPALVMALGVDAKTAIVMGLPIVGGAALVGAARHWLQGAIDLRVTIAFGITAMLGAYAGATLARGFAGWPQLIILSILMTAAAGSMWWSPAQHLKEHPVEPHRVPTTMLLVGLGTGVLTGIVGIGGGFILMPALVVLGRLSMREATGTSLTVISMNAAAAFIGYRNTVDVPWRLVLAFGAVMAAGVLLGGVIAPKVPERLLRRGFAVLLIVVAFAILRTVILAEF